MIQQLNLLSEYNSIEILAENMLGTKRSRPELIRLKGKV